MLERGPVESGDSLRERLETIRWLIPLRLVAGIAVVSVGSGIAEALALLLIVQAATALAGQEGAVAISIGPLDMQDITMSQLLWAAAAMASTRLVLHLLNSFLAAKAAAAVMARLRHELVGAFLQASWSRQSAERQGRLQDLATTHVLSATRATLFTALAITAGFNFLTMVLSAFLVNRGGAAVMAGAVVVLYLAFRPITRMARRQAGRFAAANTRYAGSVSETAGLALEVTTTGTQQPMLRRIGQRSAEASRRYFNQIAITRSLSGTYQSVALLALVLALWFVSGRDVGDVTSLGAMIVILIRALSYSQAFQSAQHSVNEQLPFAQGIQEQVKSYRAVERRAGDRHFDSLVSLQLDHVSFAYGDEPVLVDLDVSIDAGEAIGVVGPSGAGKSTLAQILLRLRTPDDGTLRVNGVPAEELSLSSWYGRIAFVPQEPHILNDTVRENVRFLRDIDDESIERACLAAHLHEEILGWADGYETQLGSGANPLSGGQRQRLCIARALATDPDLLILDEPTSALDMQSEAAIQETLRALRGRVTLVIIAHRVPTLQLCGRVLVLDGGRAAAFDAPEELQRTNAFFAEAMRLSRL
jgi:ATP-binding cassette, subfamily B, bacterial